MYDMVHRSCHRAEAHLRDRFDCRWGMASLPLLLRDCRQAMLADRIRQLASYLLLYTKIIGYLAGDLVSLSFRKGAARIATLLTYLQLYHRHAPGGMLGGKSDSCSPFQSILVNKHHAKHDRKLE